MNPRQQRAAARPTVNAASDDASASGGASSPFGFGGAWPGLGQGFDFLQQLTRSATQQSQAAIPPMAQWLTPTLDTEQIERRISELKTVQFWLEQNTRGIAATVQALEVQKLTVESLRRMNLNFAELAETLGTVAAAPPASEPEPAHPAAEAPPPTEPPTRADAPDETPAAEPSDAPAPAAVPGAAEALAWWGALGQQFQAIAQQALRGTATEPPVDEPATPPARRARARKAPAASSTPAKAAKAAKPAAKPARKRSSAAPAPSKPTGAAAGKRAAR